MLEASLAASAPAVLGAFAEKHAPNHGAMWEALLIYCRHFSAAWYSVDVAKAVLPRLTSFLRCQYTVSRRHGHDFSSAVALQLQIVCAKSCTQSIYSKALRAAAIVCSHACYGSFEISHPALLPFLSCMPQRLASTAPRQPAAIASALWQGCELLTAPAQRATAATCYQVTSLQTAASARGVWKVIFDVVVCDVGLFCDLPSCPRHQSNVCALDRSATASCCLELRWLRLPPAQRLHPR